MWPKIMNKEIRDRRLHFPFFGSHKPEASAAERSPNGEFVTKESESEKTSAMRLTPNSYRFTARRRRKVLMFP